MTGVGNFEFCAQGDSPVWPNANWIKTVPGRGWFGGMRLYAPTQAFFDKTWKPDDIVKVK